MLSLEKLKDLPDFVKEDDDDDEVTGKLICTNYDLSFSLSYQYFFANLEITGGDDDPGNHIFTRHITPKLMESGATSRTLSSSSQTDPKIATSPTITVTAPSEQKHDCQSGGIHPPSKAYVTEFVRNARRRIKYMSVCHDMPPGEIAAEVPIFD